MDNLQLVNIDLVVLHHVIKDLIRLFQALHFLKLLFDLSKLRNLITHLSNLVVTILDLSLKLSDLLLVLSVNIVKQLHLVSKVVGQLSHSGSDNLDDTSHRGDVVLEVCVDLEFGHILSREIVLINYIIQI